MRRAKLLTIICIGELVFGWMAASAGAKVLEVPGQFNSISGALEVAAPGDEVVVAPGTYPEDLILKSGVVLRSQGSNDERAKFISASRTVIQSAKVSPQIVLGAEGAVLDGFTLKEAQGRLTLPAGGYGVSINSAAMTVTNCIIASLPGNGVGIKGSTAKGASIIRNNKIYNNQGNGIDCEEGAEAQIESCEIYLNAGSGIHNAYGARPSIKRNIIRQNGVDGVMNTDKAEPVIQENEIYQNGLNGIGLQLSSKGKVVSNQIKNNRQAGVGLRLNAECIIQNNTISGNSIGIGLMDIRAALIESNRITGNNMVGVGMIACRGGKVTLRNNDLRGNRGLPMSPNFGCELIEEDNEM